MARQKSPDAFRTISEVAAWLEVNAHVLRFWESKFSQIKPVKRAGGRRYYRKSDMELLGGIKQLLHEDGLTIKGAQKVLREKGVKSVAALSKPVDWPDPAGDTAEEGVAVSATVSATETRSPEPSTAKAGPPHEMPASAAPGVSPSEAPSEAAEPAASATDSAPLQSGPEADEAPTPASEPSGTDEISAPEPPAAPAAAFLEASLSDEPASEDLSPSIPAAAEAEISATGPGDSVGNVRTEEAADAEGLLDSPEPPKPDPERAPQPTLFDRLAERGVPPGVEIAPLPPVVSDQEAPRTGAGSERPASVPRSGQKDAAQDRTIAQGRGPEIAPLPSATLSLSEALERVLPGHIPLSELAPLYDRAMALRGRMDQRPPR